jgi:hypothetical protein
MPCFHPLKGWRSKTVERSGKRKIVFKQEDGYADLPVQLPCGQCTGCRLERSRQWAMRCLHESQMHSSNCFVTLTYDQEHMPAGGTLVLRDYQLFMKRLRKRYGDGIRFYHCGEYGPTTWRPHYHALLFGLDFDDKVIFKVTNDIPVYTSEHLSGLWPHGFSTVGDVTFDSAAYVARYVMKKITGERAEAHYRHVDEFGEVHDRAPEYTTMSRRPGIGADWFKKFRSDVFPGDFVVVNGVKCRPPKFYDALYEHSDWSGRRKSRVSRKSRGRKRAADNTPVRLRAHEKVAGARMTTLPPKEL